jgi:hypothetical protein
MVAKGLFTPPNQGPTVETTAFSLASLSTIVVLLRRVPVRLEIAMRRLTMLQVLLSDMDCKEIEIV